MLKKSLKLTLLITLFCPLVVWGQVVVVSDVDDTIKVSHVLDTWDSFRRAYQTEAFWQMPELYREIDKNAVEFFYVSNAPKGLMEGSHTNFLNVNNFAPGPLLLPSFSEREGHKIRQIEKIILEQNPRILILIGDNGEKDPEFYEYITQKYRSPFMDILTFIRIDYNYEEEGAPLRPGQKSFVTAGEVALQLHRWGLLSDQSLETLLVNSLNRPGTEWEIRELFFEGASLGLPDWVDCRKHQVDLSDFYFFSPLVSELEQKIKTRCSYVIF